MGLLTSGGLDSAILLCQLLDHGWQVRPFYVRTECALAGRGDRRGPQTARGARTAEASSRSSNSRCRSTISTPTTGASPAARCRTATRPTKRCSSPAAIRCCCSSRRCGARCMACRSWRLATLAANPFDDAKPEFFERFEAMIDWATGCDVRIVRPFEMLSKRCVMQLGRDVPLELTFSCIAPVGGLHCGRCNKCAERAAAFRLPAAGDPTSLRPGTWREPSAGRQGEARRRAQSSCGSSLEPVVAHDTPQRPQPVAPADLLAFGVRPAVIRDADFVDPQRLAAQPIGGELGGDFRLKSEAILFDPNVLNDLAAKRP